MSFNYSNCGCTYINGFVVLAEGLDIFRLEAIAAGGKMNSSGNFSYKKQTLVEWKSGS
jgi:hypothetical protein